MKTGCSVRRGVGVVGVLLMLGLMTSGDLALAQGRVEKKTTGGHKTEVGKKAEAGVGGPVMAEAGEMIRIRKLVGIGNKGLIKSPEYQVRSALIRGPKPAAEWGRIIVLYDTAPEWIDEMVFQFYALAEKTEEGKKAFSFFKCSVRYVDVERGRDHVAEVFLQPAALKRFGSLVAAGVEVSIGGKVVASDSELGLKNLPETWWKDPKVVESEMVTVRDGYLVDKSKSPFSLINIDDYEVIR
jgi:hypothetical protein